VNSINSFVQDKGYSFKIFSVGSIFWLSFGFADSVRSMKEINAEEVKRFAPLHAALLEQGVYLGPSGYEVGFISAAHSMEDISKTIEAFKSALQIVFE
jgi:glutamate-1-semialdehyde 2,1-aminomutase